MAWFIGGIIYLVLVVTLGVMSIRKGHWVMFIIGFFAILLAHRRADAFAEARLTIFNSGGYWGWSSAAW